MTKFNRFFSVLAAVVMLFSTLTLAKPASANVTMYDDFFLVGNNTVSYGDPASSVNASPRNIVEFFIRVRNNGDEDAKNVQVWAALPAESSTNLVTTAFIRPNNPDRVNVQISDTTTVKVLGGQPVGLRFLDGHTRFAGVTNLFNCPNVCDINNQDILKGINVGDVPAGKEVQVAFKAYLTQAAATPTPTPTATPTPTPTPTPTCTPTPTPTATPTPTPTPTATPTAAPTASPTAAPSGQSQSQTQTQTVTVNVLGASATPSVVSNSTNQVSQLPQTGLPMAGLALTGLTPLGLKLRKIRSSKDSDVSANFIWEKRQLEK